MYEKAIDMEQYVKPQIPRRIDSRNFDSRANTSRAKPNLGHLSPQKGAPTGSSWDSKGKGIADEKTKKPSQIKCHKCHAYGHYAVTCPTRNLVTSEAHDDSDPDIDNYFPDFVPSDDDCED
ncbi:hypothetical protein AAC387_Pa11g0681 [Persea americana]